MQKYSALICDEVATGFGRTGKCLRLNMKMLNPILLFIKNITGGYLPLLLQQQMKYIMLLGKYEEFKTFFHGHSYTANPLGCAASMATIDIITKGDFLKKLQPKIKYLEEELIKLSKHKNVGNIRHCGFMAGIEIVKDKKTGKVFESKLRSVQKYVII